MSRGRPHLRESLGRDLNPQIPALGQPSDERLDSGRARDYDAYGIGMAFS
jgi:hypothetical protein